jgi:hypothetical protein
VDLEVGNYIPLKKDPMNKVLAAMALAVAFGSSSMAAETAEKPSVAELVVAANTLAACLTPLVREADKTAAEMRKSRFNHVEREIAHDKRELLGGKPDAFSAAIMIDSLARAAGRALYFNSQIEVRVAQCIEAACPVLGDAASDDFYGLAFSCRQSALGLRQRVDLPR